MQGDEAQIASTLSETCLLQAYFKYIFLTSRDICSDIFATPIPDHNKRTPAASHAVTIPDMQFKQDIVYCLMA